MAIENRLIERIRRDTVTSDTLQKYRYDEIKKYLKPVLSKIDDFSYERAVLVVREYLDELLSLNDLEKQFCIDFRNGIYKPGLLFEDDEIIRRIHNHTMEIWRTRGHA